MTAQTTPSTPYWLAETQRNRLAAQLQQQRRAASRYRVALELAEADVRRLEQALIKLGPGTPPTIQGAQRQEAPRAASL